MRFETNQAGRYPPHAMARPGEFAPLFDQLARPVDSGAVADGMRALAQWLGSPRQRWMAGADR